MEGKDIKDLLVNVGSGGGAAAAPGAAAAAGGAAAAAAPEEEKVEGAYWPFCGSHFPASRGILYVLILSCREGGVRRGYGFRSLRLNSQHHLLRRLVSLLLLCTSTAGHFGVFIHIDGCIQDGVDAYIPRPGQSSFFHKDNMINALTRRSSRTEGTNGQWNDSGRKKKNFFLINSWNLFLVTVKLMGVETKHLRLMLVMVDAMFI